MIRVEHGDCREIIPSLGVTVDAVVTDPPYHLTATLARFGKIDINDDTATSIRLRKKLDGAARLAHGFMNQQWDGGDIAFRPETWATIGTALRPGGFLVAFGGTRTYHRLACAIEDAGFVIQDCLMWLFATGFPKRRDMLKPAYEPIVLAYKPGGKRTMQVDECRVGTTVETWPTSRARPISNALYTHKLSGDDRTQTVSTGEAPPGRWPANICHDNSDEVVAAFPETESHGGGTSSTGFWQYDGRRQPIADGDSGSAARFFFSAKAGAQDRWGSRHPTVKPVELMKWLVALVCPPGGTVLDPFAGSGTTAVAALGTGRNAILIEREDQYVADIRERVAFYEGGGSHSVEAKNRNRTPHVRDGDLFAPATAPRRPKGDLGSGWDPVFAAPPFNDALDCKLSYDAAIQAIGEQVKAGEPLPTGGYFGGEE